jgi:hypothetical protein
MDNEKILLSNIKTITLELTETELFLLDMLLNKAKYDMFILGGSSVNEKHKIHMRNILHKVGKAKTF